MKALKTILIFVSFLFFVSCEKKVGKAQASTTTAPANLCDSIKYSKHIKPIIISNCSSNSGCHVSGFNKGDFTSYSGLKTKINDGSFKLRVFDSPNNPMPASGMLLQSKLDSIKCWLEKGSPNN